MYTYSIIVWYMYPITHHTICMSVYNNDYAWSYIGYFISIYESGLRIPGPPNGMVPQAHALGNTGHGTIYTYTQTYIHTYIHTYINTYIHADRQTDRQTGRQAYTHTDIRTYVRTYIHTYTHRHTYLSIYLPTYIPTYLRTHVHACMDAYIHTYLHTNIPTNIPTYHHHRPQEGGTRRTIPPSQDTGVGGPWVGGGWASWVICIYINIYLYHITYLYICIYIYTHHYALYVYTL